MNKILNLLKEIIESPEEVVKVVPTKENVYEFNFRDLDLEIGHYWSDAHENTLWFLNVHSDRGGIVTYVTSDVDLDGYQNFFQTAFRQVDVKYNGVDDKISRALVKKSKLST